MRTLQAAGHEVTGVPPKDAIGALPGVGTGVVVSHLPSDEAGLVASAVLAEHAATLILVSDDAHAPVAGRLLSAGAASCLFEPLSEVALRTIVDVALGHQDRRVESEEQRSRLAQALLDRTAQLSEATRELAVGGREVDRAVEASVRRLTRACEMRNPAEAGHIRRMSRYAGTLATLSGFDHEHARRIRLASGLHDIGTIAIPERVVRKTGIYTPADITLMRQHCEAGRQLFADAEDPLLRLVGAIAWTHHERWDGGGYPRGLSADRIPVEARITAVADVFDAMMTGRRAKPGLPIGQAVPALRELAGSQLDPELVERFVDGLPVIVDTLQAATA